VAGDSLLDRNVKLSFVELGAGDGFLIVYVDIPWEPTIPLCLKGF